jgi:hypothetical protein
MVDSKCIENCYGDIRRCPTYMKDLISGKEIDSFYCIRKMKGKENIF